MTSDVDTPGITDDSAPLLTWDEGDPMHDGPPRLAPEDDAPEEGEEDLQFASLAEFVEDFFVTVFRREVKNSQLWCPRWWAHQEAVVRLEACWRAFEQLRQEAGTGLSVWLRDHADPALRALLDEEGTFRLCREAHHVASLPELPIEPAPRELFGSEAERAALTTETDDDDGAVPAGSD